MNYTFSNNNRYFQWNNIEYLDLTQIQKIILTEFWEKNLAFTYQDERCLDSSHFIQALPDGSENLVKIESIEIVDVKDLKFIFIKQLENECEGKVYREIQKHAYKASIYKARTSQTSPSQYTGVVVIELNNKNHA